MEAQIKDCPKCKEKVGWWELRQQYYTQYHNPDGTASHASYGHGVGRGGKRKYCYNCDRDITNCIADTPNADLSRADNALKQKENSR